MSRIVLIDVSDPTWCAALARVVLFLGDDRKRLGRGHGRLAAQERQRQASGGGDLLGGFGELASTRDIGRDEAWGPSGEAIILTFSNR